MTYDVLAACQELFQGLVVQGPMISAAETRWLAKGAPLDSTDVAGILAAANVINAATVLCDFMPSTEPNYPTSLPAYPTKLPRYPDGYGGMSTPDGWNLMVGGKVVNP